MKNYPDSDFALDAKFKLDLINDILASKEIFLGRHYMKKEKWIPSINRFKIVVKDYDNSIYVEEALFRLVEIHYRIGLEDEAKKYAHLLGYNYQSSKWYENSYRIFNQDFKKKRVDKKDKSKSILEKIKSLL